MSDVAPLAGARREAGAPTGLEFTILGAEPIEYAATPGVRFHLHVTEPEGREVYTIALSSQIHIDPARRSYDDATRERLVELFGAPERWGATTHPFQWARIESLVPSFTGSTAFTVEVPCTYDLEVASAKYFDVAARRRRAAHASTSTGPCSTGRRRSPAGRARALELLGALERCRSTVWRRTIDAHYPGGGWVRLQQDTLEALAARKAERGEHSFDATVRGSAGMSVETPAHHAALRGLRALPVHAGRDEERDADAVRDRLPAGLRGRRRRTPSTARGCSSCSSRPRPTRRSAASSRSWSRAASATRGSSGGSSSGRGRSTR